jgi:hypothetical protein
MRTNSCLIKTTIVGLVSGCWPLSATRGWIEEHWFLWDQIIVGLASSLVSLQFYYEERHRNYSITLWKHKGFFLHLKAPRFDLHRPAMFVGSQMGCRKGLKTEMQVSGQWMISFFVA